MAQIIVDEGAAPSTPAAGKVTVYAKTDGLVYAKDDAGTESVLSGAALAGSASQVFSVATATAAAHAVRLDQIKRQVAQIVTSASGAVATGTTVVPADNTIPQITEGDQYLSAAITPISAASLLKIDINFYCSTSIAAGALMAVSLFQDATVNALATASETIPSAGYFSNISLTFYMTSGTTSATTFRVRAGANVAGTTTFNGSGGGQFFGGVGASHITITEYLP